MQFGQTDNYNIFIYMRIPDKLSLLSIGNKVAPGLYNIVYSRHERVVNFLKRDLIVSVGDDGIHPSPYWTLPSIKRDTGERNYNISPGPYRLILYVDRVDAIGSVEVTEAEVKVNGEVNLAIEQWHRYESATLSECKDAEGFHMRVAQSNAAFRKLAAAESITGLMSSGQDISSDVLRTLAYYYAKGYEQFRAGKLSEAVQCFRHRGLGLSPAGDDFLVGLLLGMAWLKQVQKKELSKNMDLILHESEVKDPLIRTFITQAVNLDLDADWACFLNSLCAARSKFEPWLDAILSHGASSGADQLSGFYLACEMYGGGLDLHH